MVKYILAGLLLALSVSLSWGLWQHGKASAATTELKATKADLVGLQGTLDALNKAAFRRAELEAQQSAARAKAARTVQTARAQTRKEVNESTEPRSTASPAQLDRLRRLTEAGNAAVQSAQ